MAKAGGHFWENLGKSFVQGMRTNEEILLMDPPSWIVCRAVFLIILRSKSTAAIFVAVKG